MLLVRRKYIYFSPGSQEQEYLTFPLALIKGRKATSSFSPTALNFENTDKKENKIFLIYKEIQMGSGAKSYMRKGFL
jgi:hypothetical protein